MAQETRFSVWLLGHVRDIAGALKRDRVSIALFTILMTLLGFLGGSYLMRSTHSTVHLMVAPLPANAASDVIEFAPKMDITSITLLCMSDHVLCETLAELHEGGQLRAPIADVSVLRRLLSYRITVAKETPMDLVYSSIIELRAKSREPEDAAVIVNTWADKVIEAVESYEEAMEAPILEIFNREFAEASEALYQAEEELEAWYRENNLLRLEREQQTLVEVIMTLHEDLAETEQDLYRDQGRAEAFLRTLPMIEPRVEMSLEVPEQVFARLLGDDAAGRRAKQRPDAPSKDAVQARPIQLPPAEGQEDVQALAQSPEAEAFVSRLESFLRAHTETKKPETERDGIVLLRYEWPNEAYFEGFSEFLERAPKAAGMLAQKRRIEELIQLRSKELEEVNAAYQKAYKESIRVERDHALAEEVHGTFFVRRKWIEVAKQIDYKTLLVLSRGTVWPKTYLWGFAGAAAMGLYGLFAGVFLSILVRLFVLPAMRETAPDAAKP